MATMKSSPIRAYRKLHGVKVADLASKLGVAEPTLRSYENGWRKIPAEFAVAFERATGVPRYQLRRDIFQKVA